MLVCYLDDSGTSGLPVTTLAGFVGFDANWSRLEPSLDTLMNAHGVPVFHAKEFHDTKPPFKGWSKVRKRSFAEEIFSTVAGQVRGMSMTIRRAPIVERQRSTGDLPSMSATGICFATIMMRFFQDPLLRAGTYAHGVSFIIEAGNKNEAEIALYFAQMRTQPAFQGKLHSLTFVPKTACRAIQLADYLAFYSRRHMRDQDRFSGRIAFPEPPFVSIVRRNCPLWEYGATGLNDQVGPLIDKVPSAFDLS